MNRIKHYIIIIAALLTVNAAHGQAMEIKDFFIADKSGDIDLLNWFLCGYKGFTYTGDFGKNKDGCNIRRWTKGQTVIESNDCFSSKDGKNEHVFFIIAYLSKQEMLMLENSLVKFSFKIYSRETIADGTIYTMWVPSTVNKISVVNVNEKNGTFEVTFVP